MAEYPTYGFQDKLQSRSSAEVIIESTITILITTTAIFGNIMVCWAVVRNKRLRTIPNIYVTSLAISDMVMATVVMPVSIEVLITSKFMKSFSFCQFQGFFAFFSGLTSFQMMAAMAVNRYYCVVEPAKYGKYFSLRRTIASVVIIVILAAFGAGLHLVCGWAIHTIHYGKGACFTTYKTPGHEKYLVLLFTFLNMVPACVISVCYQKIFRHVRNHKRTAFKNRKQPSNSKESEAEGTTEENQQEVPTKLQTSAQVMQIPKPSSVTERKDERQENQQGILPKPKINVKEVKTSRTLFVTVLGYMACWTPIVVIEMIDSLSSNTLPIPRQVFLLWNYLAHGSSAINPFIYGALNRSFRKEFRSILRLTTGDQIDSLPQVRFQRNAVPELQT